LGSTYLNNLSKNSFVNEKEHLPPKIECSSICTKNMPSEVFKGNKELNPTMKLKDKEIVLKSGKEKKIPETKLNPFSKKV
jgi:hypothetical protein